MNPLPAATQNYPMRSLWGASVMSAAGSLPLQILPFLVLALVSEGRVTISLAGWTGSAFLTGMLCSALLLPLMGVVRLGRWHALFASCVVVVCLALSVASNFLPALLGLWFVVGLACGSLQFLGARAAAAAPDKQQAFALRLAIALLIASGVIVALAHFHGQKNYAALAGLLMGIFTLAAAAGLVLYRDIPASPADPVRSGPTSTGKGGWAGLAVVFAFFLGQPGFWAYAMQSASQRGLDLQDAALVIAACKVIAALVLLRDSKRDRRWDSSTGLLLLGLMVGMGILLMSYPAGVGVFFLGFLVWELAHNVLSARLQGMVVSASPWHAGAWITGAIFLGAAAGPVIHGAAIGMGMTPVFIAYASLSALAPFVWACSRSLVTHGFPAAYLPVQRRGRY